MLRTTLLPTLFLISVLASYSLGSRVHTSSDQRYTPTKLEWIAMSLNATYCRMGPRTSFNKSDTVFYDVVDGELRLVNRFGVGAQEEKEFKRVAVIKALLMNMDDPASMNFQLMDYQDWKNRASFR